MYMPFCVNWDIIRLRTAAGVLLKIILNLHSDYSIILHEYNHILCWIIISLPLIILTFFLIHLFNLKIFSLKSAFWLFAALPIEWINGEILKSGISDTSNIFIGYSSPTISGVDASASASDSGETHTNADDSDIQSNKLGKKSANPTSSDDTESTSSTDNGNNIWNPQSGANFKSLSRSVQHKYIELLMELKGLNTNLFLIEYFIASIINNTSGDKSDVDIFLNKNLSTILNDQRNVQLDTHAFTRIKPYLLNNSNDSAFPSVVSYKPDNSFAYELQEELENRREALDTL